MNAEEVANIFSSRFYQKYETEIEEMKLHKMLYLAQRESLIRTGKTLFPEQIYAWKYGPVVIEVRKAYHDNLNSTNNTNSTNKLTESEKATPEEADILNYIFNTYSNKNSWSLNRLTYAEYSWQYARTANPTECLDCVMTIANIEKDAQRVASRRMAIKALGLVK